MSARAVLVAAAAALVLGACSDTSAPAPPTGAPASDAPVPSSGIVVPTPTPAPSPPPDVPERLRAVGTEPFWAADVDGASLVYKTPEFPEGTRVAVTRRREGDTVTLSGALAGKPFSLRIGAGPCSDGMSDEVYPFTATREIGPDIQRGCARRR